MGCRSSFRPSLTGFFLSCLFPFYSDFRHLCVCSAISPSSDDSIMLMCVCVCLHTHVCVLTASQLLMPFSNCLPYSLGKYLLTSYSVPVMVLDARARAVNIRQRFQPPVCTDFLSKSAGGSAERAHEQAEAVHKPRHQVTKTPLK